MGCAIGVSAQDRQTEGPLTNAEIVKLVKAGFKEKTIVLIIAARVPNFELSSDKMIQLKRSGVSEEIIVAMLAASWRSKRFFVARFDSNGVLDPGVRRGRSSSIFRQGCERPQPGHHRCRRRDPPRHERRLRSLFPRLGSGRTPYSRWRARCHLLGRWCRPASLHVPATDPARRSRKHPGRGIGLQRRGKP